MSQLRLYAPAIALLIAAAMSSVVRTTFTAVLLLALVIAGLAEHARERRRLHYVRRRRNYR